MDLKTFTLVGSICLGFSSYAQPLAVENVVVPVAPPAPPEILFRESTGRSPTLQAPPGSQYSIGNPTDEEQQYVEFINRARMFPAAEGLIFRNTTDPDVLSQYTAHVVDLNMMTFEFAALPAVPPLSINEKLTAAARLHSQDMLARGVQSHTSGNGNTLRERLIAQAYPFGTAGENVFSFARSVFHGHAGFEVDWGVSGSTGLSRGGMQDPRGHRNNIHSANFREIGVGVVFGTNTGPSGTVGPQLVTQNLASQQGATPFITGVAFYDLNTNNTYDLGEGLGGITVSINGGLFYAITAPSGGYSVPVALNGNYTVTFNGTNMTSVDRAAAVNNNANVKVDFVPLYTAPVISGPNPASQNVGSSYTFNPVGGATNYYWTQTVLAPMTRTIDALQGLSTNLLATVSPGYTITTNSGATNRIAFHLAHAAPRDQVLRLATRIRPGSNATLRYASRLGWATAAQTALVEVSSDDGATWQVIRSRAGTGNAGQTTFENITNSLAAFAGQSLDVRFSYSIQAGSSYYNQTDNTVGWFLDDIRFTDTSELRDQSNATVPGNSFVFTPATTNSYLLRAGAMVGGRVLPAGPGFVASVTPSLTVPSIVRAAAVRRRPDNRVELDVRRESGAASSFELQWSADLPGSWNVDSGATVQDLGGGVFRVTSAIGFVDADTYFRIKVLP